VYIGSEDVQSNVNWLGHAPVEEIAQTIATAHGPSGPNYVYLVQLAEALRKIGRPDADVELLEQHVLRLLPAEKALVAPGYPVTVEQYGVVPMPRSSCLVAEAAECTLSPHEP
jgi:ChaC-like protein